MDRMSEEMDWHFADITATPRASLDWILQTRWETPLLQIADSEALLLDIEQTYPTDDEYSVMTGGVNEIPHEDRSFRTAIARHSTRDVLHRHQPFYELNRVVEAGGTVVVIAPNWIPQSSRGDATLEAVDIIEPEPFEEPQVVGTYTITKDQMLSGFQTDKEETANAT